MFVSCLWGLKIPPKTLRDPRGCCDQRKEKRGKRKGFNVGEEEKKEKKGREGERSFLFLTQGSKINDDLVLSATLLFEEFLDLLLSGIDQINVDLGLSFSLDFGSNGSLDLDFLGLDGNGDGNGLRGGNRHSLDGHGLFLLVDFLSISGVCVLFVIAKERDDRQDLLKMKTERESEKKTNQQ